MATDQTYTEPGISAEEALQKCLDEMEAGSARLRFQAGLREKIGYRARKNFEENHHLWKKFERVVLRSARQIGIFAEEFARFEAEFSDAPATEILEHHAEEAIRVVKTFCPAGFRMGPTPKFRWCPAAE